MAGRLGDAQGARLPVDKRNAEFGRRVRIDDRGLLSLVSHEPLSIAIQADQPAAEKNKA